MGRLALRLARAEALPYWSIVVETCACRMSFCCTPTGAPVSSSQARYVAEVVKARLIVETVCAFHAGFITNAFERKLYGQMRDRASIVGGQKRSAG